MTDKIEVDFNKPVTNKDGDPIKVPKRDGSGEIEEGEEGHEVEEMEIGDQLVEFLEAGKSMVDSRAEGTALDAIIGDIEKREPKITERSIEKILKTFDKVLESTESTGKSPAIMTNLFEFLDDLEDKLEDDEGEGDD